jgi:hypothetical protein
VANVEKLQLTVTVSPPMKLATLTVRASGGLRRHN